MQYQWILDVLNDLRVFAKANDLAALAEQLEDTALVAASDIAQAATVADRDGDAAFARKNPATAAG